MMLCQGSIRFKKFLTCAIQLISVTIDWWQVLHNVKCILVLYAKIFYEMKYFSGSHEFLVLYIQWCYCTEIINSFGKFIEFSGTDWSTVWKILNKRFIHFFTNSGTFSTQKGLVNGVLSLSFSNFLIHYLHYSTGFIRNNNKKNW